MCSAVTRDIPLFLLDLSSDWTASFMRHPAVEILLQFSGDHLVVIFTQVEGFAMESPERIEWQSFNFLCKCKSCEFSLVWSGQFGQISIWGQISI